VKYPSIKRNQFRFSRFSSGVIRKSSISAFNDIQDESIVNRQIT